LLGGEAETHVAQFLEADAGEAGADEDEDGDGGLEDDHGVLPLERMAARVGAARLGAERFGERGVACLKRREQAGEETGAEHEGGGAGRGRYSVVFRGRTHGTGVWSGPETELAHKTHELHET